MNPMVSAPIHAATTTLTATVTAMSMIVAITGLRAFAFFLNFLNFLNSSFIFYTPFWFAESISGFCLNKYYDLINNIIYPSNTNTTKT